jgi:uncharacterized protein (DUF433 family)
MGVCVMNWQERIELNPQVLTGKPVVKGTRIAVEFVLQMLATGVSEKEILDNYPRLTGDDIRACMEYALELVRSERVFPLSA